MITTEDRLKDYRQRAEELRTIAESMDDPQNKKLLHGVAEDYLRMAQALEDARNALQASHFTKKNHK